MAKEEEEKFNNLRQSLSREANEKNGSQTNHNDVQKIELIELRNRALVEEAIVQNTIYQKIKNVMTSNEYWGIKINTEQMVDAYMEICGPASLDNQANFKIKASLVNEVIGGIIYSISKEENGVVLDPDGEINIEASITQRMLAQYSFVSGINELSREQKEYLLKSVENIVSTEEISEDRLKFYQKMAQGKLTAEDRYHYLQSTVSKHGENFTNSIEEIRQSNFIETKDELALVMIGVEYDGAKTPAEKEKKIQELLKLQEAQKYINKQTEKVDVDNALAVGREWKQNYIERKRKRAFIEYYDLRENGLTFSEFLPKDRAELLRVAFCTFEDTNAGQDMRETADAILNDMSPGLVEAKTMPDGRISPQINYKEFIDFYNKINVGKPPVKRIEEIRELYAKEEDSMAMGKLERLSSIDEKDWGANTKLEKQLAESENLDISNIAPKLRTLRFNKNKSIGNKKYTMTRQPSKKIGYTKVGNFSRLSGKKEEARRLPNDEEVNAIIATYKTLRSSITIGNLDLKNLQVNRDSYDNIEAYILSNPEIFRKFIDDVDGKKFISDSKIKSQIDLKEYADSSSDKYKRMQTILDKVRQSTKKQEKAKDTAEMLATALKDSAKFLIKRGLNFTVGERRAKKFTDTVKANNVYSTTRDATYRILKGVHQVRKAVTNPIANLFAMKETRALGPGQEEFELNDDGAVPKRRSSFDESIEVSEEVIKATDAVSKRAALQAQQIVQDKKQGKKNIGANDNSDKTFEEI